MLILFHMLKNLLGIVIISLGAYTIGYYNSFREKSSTVPEDVSIGDYTCTVEHIIDGDTFYCDGKKYRLAGIDAPECKKKKGRNGKMACNGNNPAREYLLRFVGKEVKITETGKSFDRIVAIVYYMDDDIGRTSMCEGFSIKHPDYNIYKDDEC